MAYRYGNKSDGIRIKLEVTVIYKAEKKEENAMRAVVKW